MIIFHRSSLKRAERLLKVCQLKSVKFYFGLSMVRHCPWKMCATPRACIKPGCFARRPLCHQVNLPSCVARRPFCHKVNLPSCVAWRPLCHKVNLPSCVARRPFCHKVNLPSCVARWPLCLKVNQPSCEAWRPFCHKVNLPRYDARRRHFIMTCDIYGIEINKLNLFCPSVQHRKVILGL